MVEPRGPRASGLSCDASRGDSERILPRRERCRGYPGFFVSVVREQWLSVKDIGKGFCAARDGRASLSRLRLYSRGRRLVGRLEVFARSLGLLHREAGCRI